DGRGASCIGTHLVRSLRQQPEPEGRMIMPPESPANAQTPCTIAALAALKHLPESFLREQGMRDCKYRGAAAIRIPYRVGTDPEPVHFRLALTGDDRFRWRSGSKARLYGLWRPELKDASSVVLVEGETDALTLWHHRITSLGLPGATAARKEAVEVLAGVGV